MQKGKTPMEWGKDVKGVEMSRVVIGFGQKRFKLEEMTAEEVEFWESKGVDFSFYKKKEAAPEAPKKQSKEERFNSRVESLLDLGFERVDKNFVHGHLKVTVKEVESMGVEKFTELLEGFKAVTTEGNTEGSGEGKTEE